MALPRFVLVTNAARTVAAVTGIAGSRIKKTGFVVLRVGADQRRSDECRDVVAMLCGKLCDATLKDGAATAGPAWFETRGQSASKTRVNALKAALLTMRVKT